MISSFTATNYEDQDTSVSWLGQSFSNSDDLISFLRTKVRARLDDIEGKEDLRNHIAGLALTGMGKKSLAAMLEAENPQKPAWAGGEALAEAYLAETKSAIFRGIRSATNATH